MTTFVALDFETADHGRDSACSVGLIRVENDRIVQRVHYLIRPPRATFRFSHIHGIRWQDVADQPGFDKLWASIQPVLHGAAFLAAHNAAFDKGFYTLAAICIAFRDRHNPLFVQCNWLARPGTFAPLNCQMFVITWAFS